MSSKLTPVELADDIYYDTVVARFMEAVRKVMDEDKEWNGKSAICLTGPEDRLTEWLWKLVELGYGNYGKFDITGGLLTFNFNRQKLKDLRVEKKITKNAERMVAEIEEELKGKVTKRVAGTTSFASALEDKLRERGLDKVVKVTHKDYLTTISWDLGKSDEEQMVIVEKN